MSFRLSIGDVLTIIIWIGVCYCSGFRGYRRGRSWRLIQGAWTCRVGILRDWEVTGSWPQKRVATSASASLTQGRRHPGPRGRPRCAGDFRYDRHPLAGLLLVVGSLELLVELGKSLD